MLLHGLAIRDDGEKGSSQPRLRRLRHTVQVVQREDNFNHWIELPMQ